MSAWEQSNNDYGIASSFDCDIPCVNGCDFHEPKVDSVIFQNNTVSTNDEAPVSFVTAELSNSAAPILRQYYHSRFGVLICFFG